MSEDGDEEEDDEDGSKEEKDDCKEDEARDVMLFTGGGMIVEFRITFKRLNYQGVKGISLHITHLCHVIVAFKSF